MAYTNTYPMNWNFVPDSVDCHVDGHGIGDTRRYYTRASLYQTTEPTLLPNSRKSLPRVIMRSNIRFFLNTSCLFWPVTVWMTNHSWLGMCVKVSIQASSNSVIDLYSRTCILFYCWIANWSRLPVPLSNIFSISFIWLENRTGNIWNFFSSFFSGERRDCFVIGSFLSLVKVLSSLAHQLLGPGRGFLPDLNSYGTTS